MGFEAMRIGVVDDFDRRVGHDPVPRMNPSRC
jgi:hypothetical protein